MPRGRVRFGAHSSGMPVANGGEVGRPVAASVDVLALMASSMFRTEQRLVADHGCLLARVIIALR